MSTTLLKSRKVKELVSLTWKIIAKFVGAFHVAPLRGLEARIERLNDEYGAAETKLLTLKDELNVLLRCARVVREERAQISQDRLRDWEASSYGPTVQTGDDIDRYLMLAKKGKEIDKVIKALKEECASARSERSYLSAKIRHDLITQLQPLDLLGRIFRRPPFSYMDKTISEAETDFTDKEAVAERITSAENTATNVGAFVGAFGAGIAYTTIFSATRGRLDLISWAFSCFIVVIMNCAVIQVLTPPRHIRTANFLRSWNSQSMLEIWVHRSAIYIALALPILAGVILLALSVAFLDATSQVPTPGSQSTIVLAGYLPVGFIGFLGLFLWLLILIRQPRIL